jgi:DNA-binding winged helix-turn-helix (wHTH) protein
VKVRFSDIEFDSDSRRLLRGGCEIHISTKAFDLLTLLVERRPNAVGKAEIREYLWRDTFVSDANLPTLVAEIRKAIGDAAKRPRFVRTLHGIGYAFQADVEKPSASPQTPDTLAAGWLVGAALRIAVFPGENVLGREGADVIAVESPTVSRRHVRLTIDERGAVVAEDLGSKNGTYLNDQPVVGPMPVADGDVVRIGSLVFTFRIARPVTSTQTV